MRLRTILIGLAVVVVAFVAATVAIRMMSPSQAPSRPPALAEVAPLPPMVGKSVVVTPIGVSLPAIAEFMEATAPRDLSGQRDFQVRRLISNGEIHWTVNRGALSVAGSSGAIEISAPLTGTMRATGQLSQAGGIAGALSQLLAQNGGRGGDKRGGRNLDQRADMRGSALLIARPALTPVWRIEPNLSVKMSVSDASLNLGGMRVNLAHEVQPLLERTANEHLKKFEAQLRNDPTLEQAARREWAKLCRSQAIGSERAGLPDLWLELRPTRITTAQPRVDAASMIFLLGIEAEARIGPLQTRPDCPFPAQVEIVPPADAGHVAIALPIDVPFSEVNRLIATQLAGRTVGEGKGGSRHFTIRQANVTPSGDRLLISLRVQPQARSWFGLAGESTVHVWGRPVLDGGAQVLRLADVTVDVDSEGVFGPAAKTVAPLLAAAVGQQATIDLKPYAANASRSIAAALADFRTAGDGVQVDAAVTAVRLTGIAFDATTLRLIAELDGSAKVAVSKLPLQ